MSATRLMICAHCEHVSPPPHGQASVCRAEEIPVYLTVRAKQGCPLNKFALVQCLRCHSMEHMTKDCPDQMKLDHDVKEQPCGCGGE